MIWFAFVAVTGLIMYNRIGQMKHCNYISVRSLTLTEVLCLCIIVFGGPC